MSGGEWAVADVRADAGAGAACGACDDARSTDMLCICEGGATQHGARQRVVARNRRMAAHNSSRLHRLERQEAYHQTRQLESLKLHQGLL